MRLSIQISWVWIWLPLFASCQRIAPLPPPQQEVVRAASLVEAQDGTLYDISCLRKNASQIASEGRSAMSQCESGKTAAALESAGTSAVEKGRMFTNYGYAYYPPNYYGGTRYQENLFCGYVFGVTWGTSAYNYNCVYDLFLYPNTTTTNGYYNNTCNSCYQVTTWSQYSTCSTYCWRNQQYYYY